MKKIEKERTEHTGEYAPVVRAVIVLILLVLALVGVILYSPKKKDELVDPNMLVPDEMIVDSSNHTCDGNNTTSVKEAADKVTLTYEEVDDYFFGYMAEQDEDINGNGVIDEEPVVENFGYALKIKLDHMSDKIFVKITNDLDDNVKLFHNYDAKDGVITWFEDDTTFLRIYNVKIYSANENCNDELYREFKVTLPKWNVMSGNYICETTYKDEEICQPFTFSNKNDRQMQQDFKKFIIEKEKEIFTTTSNINENTVENKQEDEGVMKYINIIINFIKSNLVISILAGVALIIVILLVIIKLKGRK